MRDYQLHIRKSINKTGYTELVSPETSELKHISLGILRINRGEHRTIPPTEQEQTLVILCGRCILSCLGFTQVRIGERPDVFGGKASAIYLPAGQGGHIEAESNLEIAMVSIPGTASDLTPGIVLPDNVRHRDVGQNNWRRDVYDIIDNDFPAQHILLGETINPPGNWSGSPAHKHDRHTPPHETAMEEVYFFRVEPPQGFGMQRIYTDDREINYNYTVEDNDVVIIPRGYHPVVAAPGYRLYYLWILAGTDRKLIWHEDPSHSWIHSAPTETK
jgi:5-deoxy-glucuronate isomerase